MKRTHGHQRAGTPWRGLAAAALLRLLGGGTTVGESTPPSLPHNAAEPIGLGYRLYAGGLHALTFDAEIDMRASTYRVDLVARTDGIVGRFFTMILTAEAEGERAAGALRPKVFRTANRWQDNDERWVRLTYGEGDMPSTEAEPPPSEDDRNSIPEAERRDTVDPITAVFDLLGADGSPACEGRAAVFDGRRRYDLEAERIGESGLRATRFSVYGGEALECRLIFRQIDGFWKKPKMRGRYPREIRVWVAKVHPDAVAVPVRMAAETRFAAVRVHLTRLDLPPGTEQAPSGSGPDAQAQDD